MNAHSQNEYGLLDGHYDDFTDMRYEITFKDAVGGFGAGDTLIFDTDEEPGAGEIIALRRDGVPGVQVGHLITDLPTARWADLQRGDDLSDGSYVFAFKALEDDTPRIIEMSELAGIDMCVDIQRAEPANDDAPSPKRAKPTPARGPDGRFLPRDHAAAEADVEQTDERKPWEDVPNWTPEQSFMFRLEGDLYQLTALSAMLETLLTPITHKMAGYDRPASAALDYAVTNLADAVREIEERYMAVRFPDKADAA